MEECSPAVSPISFATVIVTGSVSPVISLVGVLEVSSVVVRINEHSVCVVGHKSKNVQPSINVDVTGSVLDLRCRSGSGCGRRNNTRDGRKNCRRLSCGTDGVVTVDRKVVVIGLSRVEGRYVKRVGTRYVEVELLKRGKGVVDRRYVVVLRVDVVEGRVDAVVFAVTTGSGDNAGRVVFGAIVVVTGLGVVVVVGSVVARGV